MLYLERRLLRVVSMAPPQPSFRSNSQEHKNLRQRIGLSPDFSLSANVIKLLSSFNRFVTFLSSPWDTYSMHHAKLMNCQIPYQMLHRLDLFQLFSALNNLPSGRKTRFSYARLLSIRPKLIDHLWPLIGSKFATSSFHGCSAYGKVVCIQ